MPTQPSILGRQTGPIGFGLMGFTWREQPQAFEKSIQTMKRSLELGYDNINWNAGEFYGTIEKNSLHLLKDYLTQYPDDASKFTLSIKGGGLPGTPMPDASEQNTRRSLDTCLELLKDTSKPVIDIFEMARIDPKRKNRDAHRVIVEYIKAGKVRGLGLSEVSAKTIRETQKQLQEELDYPEGVASVEIELSLWCPDPLQNGILATCAELGIPVFAYSPLARGALTDKPIRSNAEIPENDFRKHLPKFQDDVLEANNRITDAVNEIAKKHGATTAQIAIGWVSGQSGRTREVTLEDGSKKTVKLPSVIPIPGATTIARVEENLKEVILNEEEMKELDDLVDKFPTTGDRYAGEVNTLTNG
ncbi:hypothetical protein LTS08_008045 [Lithohypha guttulata]|nr:hypothetical protein LTS08_008045 [Lithohypha guttulata]